MAVMEQTRDEAQKRAREERTGQKELGLFSYTMPQDPSDYFRSLRERYVSRSKAAVQQLIQAKRHISYDEAWSLAMTFPLTWESDLKDWLGDWKKERRLELTGMKESQRVPRLGQNIRIVLKG